MDGVAVSERVRNNCRRTPHGRDWLKRLPEMVSELENLWSLSLGPPIEGDEISCSWVAPVTRGDGAPAVLKLGMPQMEGEHEIDGLRFWDGDPTVELIEADVELNAMLLERCEPGTVLRALSEPEQDLIIADLLKRLWRTPAEPHSFRPLSEMTAYWSKETMGYSDRWSDPGLVREGLRLFEELPRTASASVLLATDLHAGNVLSAQREPWLVIDPKPFVGDPAYDATQHLFNCRERLAADPTGLIDRFADLLGVESNRVRLWTFARAAAESRGEQTNDDLITLARALAP